MKSILSAFGYGILLIVLASACRDTGAYTYSGVLVDSCLSMPIAHANVSVYAGITGDQKTTTNENGFFKISGGWDENRGFLHKEIIPALEVESGNGAPILSLDMLPEGNHSLGTISVQNHLRIPFKIDTSGYNCTNCEINITLRQPSIYSIRYFRYQSLPVGTFSGTLHFTGPLHVDLAKQIPATPIYLNVWRNDSVSFNYPEIDITQYIRFCESSDTVTIVL